MGLALLFMTPRMLLMFFILVVFLETGHSLSPIVLAWTHRGFRGIMLARPYKHLLLPGIVFAAAVGVGAVTSLGWTSLVYGPGNILRLTGWTNPFPALVWIYSIWNIYHFGMQNFGVAQLYRRNGPRNRRQRLIDKYACLTITALGMTALPAITRSPQIGLLCLGIFSFSHWMTAIGLCSAVSRSSWLFIAGVLLLGGVGLVWMVPTSAGNMIRVIPVVIGARIGLGFVHFLYDRWLWKLSDPQVRATIGRDLRF